MWARFSIQNDAHAHTPEKTYDVKYDVNEIFVQIQKQVTDIGVYKIFSCLHKIVVKSYSNVKKLKSLSVLFHSSPKHSTLS